MSTHGILSHLALGYAPMLDRQHAVLATRLTVFPQRPDLRLDAAELLAAVNEVWSGAPVVLSVLSETLLRELLNAPLNPQLMLEVPAFMATDPVNGGGLKALKAAGNHLILKGRPREPLAPELQALFKYQMLDLAEEQAEALPGGAAKLVSGIASSADFAACFERGASAVLGWPLDMPVPPAGSGGRSEVQADLQAIVQLMSQVDRGEDIDKMEATLKRDPSLAFKLLRYMNSAAFGLSVEVTSFRHAIMLLGMSRLKRWLALLLTTASKDHSMRPIMFASLRRGLLMEELAQSMDDREMRDEMFICGLFSLLDRMLKQPFDKLLQSIPMPERVRQALVDGNGPYCPYLELVRTIEAESVFDIRQAADALMLDPAEVNHALLRTLYKAGHLE